MSADESLESQKDSSPSELGELFWNLLESPSAETYLRVRKKVIESGCYKPYSYELREIDALLAQEKYQEAQNLLQEAMPNLLLSPRAHLFRAWIAEKTGNSEEMQMEREIAGCIARGILSTGDGSASRPYVVMRTTDEHDLVGYLGKEFSQQALLQADGKSMDRVACSDGSSLCFDITDAYNSLKIG
jgi:hypothetical protein